MSQKQQCRCKNCRVGRDEEGAIMCENCGAAITNLRIDRRAIVSGVFYYVMAYLCVGVPIFTFWRYGFKWGWLGLLFPLVHLTVGSWIYWWNFERKISHFDKSHSNE
jgi:hypothetical protein